MSATDDPRHPGTSPEDDARRVAALRDLELLDTPPDERFDRIVRLAQQLFGVPTVGVNLIDADRAFTKSGTGALRSASELPRADTLCTFVVQGDETLEIDDTLSDPRWAAHPAAAGDPAVRFYAGAPLRAAAGERIGTLCLIDEQPRRLSARERGLLRDLADWVEREMATSADLEQGRELQRRLLPRRMPQVPGWELAGACVQAGAVGGDLFDVQQLGDGQVQLLLADVMGKGLSAALIAAGVRVVARGTSAHNSLERTIDRVAADLQEDLDEAGSFVTAFAARIDPVTGATAYVDAGHGLAFVADLSGGWRRIRSEGLPIGALPGDSWPVGHDRISIGEALVVVSDGLLDLHPDVAALGSAIGAGTTDADSARDLVARLTASSAGRIGDDVTVVVARRTAAR